MSDQRIKAIVEGYCTRIHDELANFSNLVGHIQSNEDDNGYALQRAYQEAHRLSGAACCMGFERFGELLANLEHHLESVHNGSSDGGSAFLEIDRLRSAIVFEQHLVEPARSALLTGLTASPAAGRNLAVSPSARTDDHPLKGQEVLLADDDVTIRGLARNLLVHAGAASVILAASGAEALQSLVTSQPTLIISDWNMPDIDGLGLLSRVRKGQTSLRSDTPVILLTSERREMKLREAINLEVNQFITKPFTRQSFISTIRSVMYPEDSSPVTILEAQGCGMPR